ncbi:MAG: alpha/beta fold hydrolase [Bacteroidia bacterium]|nr:alpha/beta fold hydrolase [Bacteroidia bacterium]
MVKLKILTDDEYQLSVTAYKAKHALSHTVIVNCATGVKQRFYSNFAKYLSQQGFDVFTYDYRGIGESRPKHLRALHADFKDWAQLDFAAVVTYAQRELPSNKLSVIGHSLGGQLPGLTSASMSVDHFVLVGSQTPYWKNYNGFMKAKVWLLWHVLIPVLTALFGYFPSRLLGLFEDLPKGAAQQWARWGKCRRYMFDEYPHARLQFETLAQPALVFNFSDDALAPAAAVADLMRFYANLVKEKYHIEPAEIGRKQIGHFNFFKNEFCNPFWITVTQWLIEKGRSQRQPSRAA